MDLKSGSSGAADHDRERLQIDLNTANIVKAGEQLLQLVDELKLPVIANDFERCALLAPHPCLLVRRCALGQHVDVCAVLFWRSNNVLAAKREAVLASMTARVDMGVAQLSRELADGITELETHYYSSNHRD